MTLSESIGRFNIRKTLRFEMMPLGKTADFLDGHLEADEERAASLNKVKSAIEAEHLTMVRRVFKSLPDPIPRKFEAVRAAFRRDPEFEALSSRDARGVMQAILGRCRENGWAIPKELSDHDGWPTLTVKWHWHCFSKYDPVSANALTRKWTGKNKAEIQKSCPLLRAPKRRKPGRNYWFDHSPFRVMFGNRSVGMNWQRDDWNLSRTFLLTDDERVVIGIAPRESAFTPYGLPDAANDEPSYLLYEEEGGAPRMRAVPKDLIDRPANAGFVYLFELTGRALRGKTNLNALYLRALLSPANFSDPTFHLRKGCEFFVRKSAEIRKDGNPEHFRQRFNGDRFFVSLRIALNSHIAGVGHRPIAFGDLSKFITENPTAKFILVDKNGKSGEAASSPLEKNDPSSIAGQLAKRVVNEDAYVIFDPKTPKRVLQAVERKFNYIVIRGRDPLEPGGVLRGYQIPHRLFVGDLAAAKKEVAENRALLRAKQDEKDAEAKLRAERAARKAAGRARAEAEYQSAQERRRRMEEIVNGSKPIALIDPIFSQGKYTFTFRYKTSDNVDHVDTCRADDRDEAFQKLRTVRIRPIKVWCDDPSYAGRTGVPPVPADPATRLKQLDALKSQGLITEAEYAEKRGKILAEL